jgi:hypothetical protein
VRNTLFIVDIDSMIRGIILPWESGASVWI